jgi:hypothetical protein
MPDSAELRAPAAPAPPAVSRGDGAAGPLRLVDVLHALRDLGIVAAALTALLAFLAVLLGGTDVVALVFVPLAFLVAALTRPEALLLLLLALVTLLVLVSATATLGAVFRAPLLALAGRLAAAESGPPPAPAPAPAPPLPAEVVLRRRYVAGELGYEEFREGMTGLLRERYARGELALAAYEAALDELLRPARHLDVRGDPGLAAAPARPPRGAGPA